MTSLGGHSLLDHVPCKAENEVVADHNNAEKGVGAFEVAPSLDQKLHQES